MEEFLKSIGFDITTEVGKKQIQNYIWSVYPYLTKEEKQEATRILIKLEKEEV